jgi:hypothetical protein
VLICELLILSCPPNVACLVVAVIIDTVYAVLRRRSWPKLSKPLLKTREPELNAATTIAKPTRTARPCAAVLGVVESNTLRRLAHTVASGVTMNKAARLPLHGSESSIGHP